MQLLTEQDADWEEQEKIAGALHLGPSHILCQTLFERSSSGDRDRKGVKPTVNFALSSSYMA